MCRSVYILTVSVCFVLLVLVVGCGKKETLPLNQEKEAFWSSHIASFTSGTVSRASTIRIEFTHDVAEKADPFSPAPEIFQFTPAISGKTRWVSERSIEFVPDPGLKPGESYKAELKLEKLISMPPKMSPFFFSFSVMKQAFEVSYAPLSYEDLKNLKVQKIEGLLYTADVEDPENVKKVVNADQNGTKLDVVWNSSSDRQNHHFTIAGVVRKEEVSFVTISWNGAPIGAENINSATINVPKYGVFDLINYESKGGESPFALLTFSDPLNEKQSLEGIIISGNNKLHYAIEENRIKVYFPKVTAGTVSLFIEPGLENTEGKTFNNRKIINLLFESPKPGIRFVGKGIILPDKEDLTVPFEAVSLKSVKVTAMEIYYENMGQFLQVNQLEGDSELTRVGRYLWEKSIDLNASPEKTSRWSRYYLDVRELFEKYPNRMFRIILSFSRDDSAYPCAIPHTAGYVKKALVNLDDVESERSYWDYSDEYGESWNEEEWENRNDPCSDAYYKKRYNSGILSAGRNFIASNIGIITKSGPGNELFVIVTDIRTARPLQEAVVTVFNYQNRPLGKGKTDNNGFLHIKAEGKPFFIEVLSGKDKGFLRLSGDGALLTSHFETSGELVKKGLKGFIYGERGVWRPGDDIFLTFIFDDPNKTLPENHPVTLELINPQGASAGSFREKSASGSFHTFEIKTQPESPTGNWTARIKLGGVIFEKMLKIETIVPNRIKIETSFNKKVLKSSDLPEKGIIKAEWLHGAPASNLNADISLKLAKSVTRFSKFQDFIFDDPVRSFESESKEVKEIFNGVLDQSGKADFLLDSTHQYASPGVLEATFVTRVHEEGGGFSTDRFSIPFYQYERYIGIRPPKGDKARNMLLTDKQHKLEIVSLTPEGKNVSVEYVEISMFKIGWNWWWDKSGENNLAKFENASVNTAVAYGTVSTKNGSGSWNFIVKYPEWGRYLIRACDKEGGHCAGQVVFIDWPGWAGRGGENGAGATMLSISTDRNEYEAGEEAVLFIPASKQGNALLSVENGSKVLEQRWIAVSEGENKISVRTKPEWTPNVYFHVTLLLPHASKKSDAPIRLYGIVPVTVKNKETQLLPEISVKEQLKPLEKFKVSVSERSGREMDYTIAMVDEGLLSLTRFATPDPHKEFYKKEALGVKTWDVFDFVADSYGGVLERLLSLGGDESIINRDSGKHNRFPPVVKFFGPFRLKSGEKNEHLIELPQYIGAVRFMLVAGRNGAYGMTEKSVKVKEDLMLLPAAPRLVGPGEELKLPVTIFAGKELGKVTVDINADNSLFQIVDEKLHTVLITKSGEQTVYFTIRTKSASGKGRILFTASGGSKKANSEIWLPVITRNPKITYVKKAEIAPGSTITEEISPSGIDGTNSLAIELTSIYPLGLEKRSQELISYPHGCVEQTTSIAFAQLALTELAKLSPEAQKKIEHNVKAAINKLSAFQAPSGAFNYWPGPYSEYSAWSTNWVGHFLVEAQKKGYYVSSEMLGAWKAFQTSEASLWRQRSVQETTSPATQAYRLYTLALAGYPELAVMNRMRFIHDLDKTARNFLAAAYLISGQAEAARNLLADEKSSDESKCGCDTFGSPLREKAVEIIAFDAMDRHADAEKLIKEAASELYTEKWLSTQSTAFTLVAIASHYSKSRKGKFPLYSITFPGQAARSVSADRYVTIEQVNDWPLKGKKITIRNDGAEKIFASFISRGVPANTEEDPRSDGISLRMDYSSPSHAPVSIESPERGSDIVISATVKNISGVPIDNLALTIPAASGFEIHNPRFNGEEISDLYQDIRDDRVFTYFSLKADEEKTVKVLVNASYPGKFYLPSTIVEAMYDSSIGAAAEGTWISIDE